MTNSGLPGFGLVFMRVFPCSVNKGKPTLCADSPILKRPGQRVHNLMWRCSFSKRTHQMKLLTFFKTYKAYCCPVAVCTDFLNASPDANFWLIGCTSQRFCVRISFGLPVNIPTNTDPFWTLIRILGSLLPTLIRRSQSWWNRPVNRGRASMRGGWHFEGSKCFPSFNMYYFILDNIL